MKLQYHLESDGYSVMDGKLFIGRVRRTRSSYDHSNGRTYRSWTWSAFPVRGHGSFHHGTRSKAGAWLRRAAVGETES